MHIVHSELSCTQSKAPVVCDCVRGERDGERECVQTNIYVHTPYYGVATISRLLKIIGFFCRILSL